MYDLLIRGAFGNRLRMWTTDQAYLDSGFDGLVGIRCIGSGLPCRYYQPMSTAVQQANELRELYSCDVVYNEMSPDEKITIQGELSDGQDYYAVEYSTKKAHMRGALALERISVASRSMPAIIRRHFSERSLEDLYLILDQFPGCVVEFTAFNTYIGDLPGRNVIVWEVRHY